MGVSETADADGHNFHAWGLKRILLPCQDWSEDFQVMFLGPKEASEAISEYQNFSWGSMPPDPPSLAFGYKYWYKSWTNAILLPLGLSMTDQCHHYFPCTIDVWSCFQGGSTRSTDKFFSRFMAKHMLFTRSCPTSKRLPMALLPVQMR